MSRPTMARANFKKYTDITNPLASQQNARAGEGGSTRAWRDSDGPKSKQQEKERQGEKEEEEEEEEEDPFGLGAIMSKATRDAEESRDDEEEEEDPFGLGAIMDKTSGDAPDANGKRKSGGGGDGESRSSKAQKTATSATTGGYFKGTKSSTSTQSAVAEARRQPFRAAGSFEGARKGYVFQKGPLGVGYYADSVQLRAAAAAEAAAALAASRSKSRAAEGVDAGKVSTAATAASRTEGGGRKPQTVDVAASLQKLKGFILKPKKAAKASSLLADLMEAQMRPENARMFFRALKPLAEEPAGEAALAAGEGGKRAFELLVKRASEWVATPAEGVRAVTWELLFGLRHEVR
ncbi:unnamed protein product [Hapterophycus canaliculatus]